MNSASLSHALDRVSAGVRQARDKEGMPLKLHAIVVSDRQSVHQLEAVAPDRRVDLRSVSKPVLSLLLGVLRKKHPDVPLTAETPVWPIFSMNIDLAYAANLEPLAHLKVKHLLNSTVGHHDGIMFRKDIGDRDEEELLSYVFNSPIAHAPGTHFVYSNAGAFILSAMISRLFGRRADELAREHLFEPLGIENVRWRRFGSDCAGCTGLELNALEINDIGRRIQDAKYGSLAPEGWRTDMLTSFYPTPNMTDEKRALPKRGYGHFLWKSRSGHCYTDGTDGQYLILCGDGETVITVTGEQPDMKPIGEALRPLLDLTASQSKQLV